MTSSEWWIDEEDREPGFSQVAGDCGLNTVIDEKIYSFSNSNFFLGLGGVPNNKWFSISPFTVSLQEDNRISSFFAEFDMPALTEYYLSPPAMRVSDEVFLELPLFHQTPVCQRGRHYGLEL